MKGSIYKAFSMSLVGLQHQDDCMVSPLYRMNKQVKTYDGSFSGAVVGFWYNIFLFTFPFVQSYLLGIERVNANV
jgi:hypothetical protein